ncbi:MAG TPA: chromosome segregation protein SMC [Chloroflexota bacterium]|nr:chromosome segregation protein SMC [Chloroflexota bacterium]
MRLKKIELHGFKTFASRATLEFAPGITAIVGPNGSGKSNVADAIRWALGEQSVRLLRGRKTEDVIFGGGSGRAPLGMAEVTVTLDNADGALPPEFAEVAVARRAFRSGEGEYSINRSRVRLRDIVDLLSRAGIGQNGHSVVGQGLVDMALSLKPEERRTLFEDAAGMRRYHAKKAEADSKLSEVATNATRVADLLAELEPRVTQLQRQARRAQDESKLREQWRRAAHALFSHQRWEIDSALDRWTPEFERLAGERAAAVAAAAAAAAAAATERDRLVFLKEQRDQAGKEHAILRERVERARREAAVAQERHAGTRRAAQELRVTVDRLEARLSELGVRQATADRAQRESAAALSQARLEVQAAVAAIQAGPPSGDSNELRTLRGLVVERGRALTQAITQLREAEGQLIDAARQERESADGQRRAVGALEAQRTQLERLDGALRDIATRLESQRIEAHTAKVTRTAADEQVRLLTQRVTQAERDGQALHVRLNVLRDVIRGQIHETAGAATGQTLAEQLRVPAAIEAAAGAALGEALGWVIVDTVQEAHALATRHAQNGAGRATFIARASRPARPRTEYPPLPDHEHGLGYLLDQLTADHLADIEQAPHAPLLAGSYVVRDLPAALTLASRLNGDPRPAIVTLAGELVSPIGAITTGAPPAEAATLQRLRELRDVEAALLQHEAAITPLQQQLTQAQHEQNATVQVQLRLEAPQRALAQEGSRLSGERRALEQQLLQLEKDAHWWSEFASRALAQQAGLLERVTQLTEQQRRTEELHLEAEQQAGEKAAGAEQREALLAALREQASASRTAFALAEQRNAQAGRDLTAAQLTTAAAERDAAAASGRLEEVTGQLDIVAAAAVVATADAETAAATFQTTEGQVAVLTHEIAAAEAAVESSRSVVERSQVRAGQAERDGALLEAQRATLVERARALRDQAERELGDLPPPVFYEAGAEALRSRSESLNSRLRSIGPINQVALQEHQEASERLEFLKTQLADLHAAATSLDQVRAELDAGLDQDFGATFTAVAEHFRTYFTRLFGGGDAQLLLTDPKNLAGSGVEIVAQLPGKRRQELALLSGGERSLVAAALLFALLKSKPSPFCVLDEVDAALDEANVGRFCDALAELSEQTQFLVVTHNRATMERAGALYGVTLGPDGVSRVVSLRLPSSAADATTASNPANGSVTDNGRALAASRN